MAFLAILCGTLVCCGGTQNGPPADSSFEKYGLVLAGGLLLLLIGVVTLKSSVANFQHTSDFYEVACGSYALPLAAIGSIADRRAP